MGSVSQQVVVTSEAPLINTTNANIGAEVNSKQIVELPLNDRNVYGLIQLNSSVQTGNLYQTVLGGAGNSDNADQDVTFLNFAGGYFGTSAYLLDGTWDTAINSWGGVISVPSVDDTQEFKIQTQHLYGPVRMEFGERCRCDDQIWNQFLSRRRVRLLSRVGHGCQSLV